MHCLLCSSPAAALWARDFDDKHYLKCGICDLVWMEESRRPDSSQERARYLEHHNFVDDPGYLSYLNKLALPVLGLVDKKARGLDYGAGPVEGMRAVLEPRGYQVSSYDPIFFPNQELLKNHYDFVLCAEAAEHFFSPREEFEKLNKLLVPGGILGVTSQLVVLDIPRFLKWNYRNDPTHVVFYSEKSVRWIAQHFGWELLKLESPLWIFRKGDIGRL